ncbi:pleckstrin homology domain-containing family O member 1-A isoform X2 [Syngnathoides biaculeatus]|uniref:pleckstrin homology domain-containing family O member 1-A isoform X2 n=1 Tax=Syngnathoides biaculeatus TaxID=300417 RepID=UPI002ADDEDDD|nr:pleckstrin homology domain-containing family O member 1-A isoform X2 [Syngnathoides biaculeatus]
MPRSLRMTENMNNNAPPKNDHACLCSGLRRRASAARWRPRARSESRLNVRAHAQGEHLRARTRAHPGRTPPPSRQTTDEEEDEKKLKEEKKKKRSMKKSNHAGPGPQDPAHPGPAQPDKSGWLRKFCGRGIFRELWRSRYVVLRGEHLFISDKEVRDERKAQEVLDLADYERSEELRKAKSRSKKNHSRFTLIRCRRPGNAVQNLLFLAVSPEEKESWINALNAAIVKAKNRVLDQVTMEGDTLVHPTRDRAKIPQGRRLPTRGHLMTASSSCHGMLTLDLVAEEEGFSSECDAGSWENVFRAGSYGQVTGAGGGGRQRSGTDVSRLRVRTKEPKVKTGSLPRGSERSWGKYSHLEASKVHKSQQLQVRRTKRKRSQTLHLSIVFFQVLHNHSRTPQPGKRTSIAGRSRCASMDEVLSSRPAMIRSELRWALGRRPGDEEGGSSVQPVGQLQSLIAQKMQRAQELLEEIRLQELQKAKAERERGGSSTFGKGVESPHLHHLRAGDSPRSRSSSSPRSRNGDSPGHRRKDSPRLRGRESPRSKARKNRSRDVDSPRSRGSRSPARAADPPRPTASPRNKSCDSTSEASDPPASPLLRLDPDKGPADFPAESPSSLHTGDNSSCASHNKSKNLQESPDDAQTKTPQKTAKEEEELQKRRAEAERLLLEAMCSWQEAQEVLQEVKELQSHTLRRQRRRTYEKMTPTAPTSPIAPTSPEASGDADTCDVATSPEDVSESP